MIKIMGFVLLGLGVMSGIAMAADLSLGFKAGLADPEHGDNLALAVGGLVRGQLAPKWRLEGSLEYWGVDNFRDVSFNGTAAYEVPVTGKIKPYFGGGVGLHIQTWTGIWWVNHGDILVGEDHSETDLGLHFLGGADYELNPKTKIITEVKYAVVSGDNGVNALSITGGLAFKLK